MSKKNKTIIIVVSVVVLIAILAIVGYIVIRNMSLNESVGSTWGDTYYAYLKEIKTAEDKTQYGLEQDINNVSVEFIQASEDKNPVMVMSYQKDNEEYSNIYYANELGGVSFTQNYVTSSVEYLYNIEKSEYSWYLHQKFNDIQTYQSIDNITNGFSDNSIETDTVSFNQDSFIRNEENMNVSDFDKVFVETGLSNNGKISLDLNSNDTDYRNSIENAVNGYKTDEELATDEIKQNVSLKVEEITKAEEEEKKQEEIEQAKLTNDNVATRIGDNLKWFTSAYLGTTYGWGDVYEYKDVTGEVSIPGQGQYMMTYELVGLNSINDLKTSLQAYMASDVISKLASNPVFDQYLEEYEGKVYWLSGGVGDGPEIDYDKAKVISSDGTTYKILLENYNVISNTKTEEITLTVNYQDEKYMITDYEVNELI